MRKPILILVPVIMILSGFYLLSDWGKPTRNRIKSALELDEIYLNDNEHIRGWIWNETEEAVMGKKNNGDLFTVKRTELEHIENNVLLTQLKQLL